MANPGTLPITLVTILLLVAPGFLAIQTFLWFSERNYALDRTEKIVWSSAASLVSLFVVYAASPVHFDIVVGIGRFLSDDLGLVNGPTVLGSSLSTAVVLYLVHLTVLFGGAGLVAKFDTSQSDGERDRREPWRYAFDDAGGGDIVVTFDAGSRVRGEYDPEAWDASTKDLYLTNPTWLSRETVFGISQGILVRSEQIASVEFVEDDPESEQVERIDASEEVESDVNERLDEIEGNATPDPPVSLEDDEEAEDGAHSN